MFKLKGRKPNDNLTIMNVFYRYGKKNEKTGKWEKDYAVIIYKDNNTGQKFSETIYEPEYTWYLANPGVKLGPHTHFIEFDKVRPITTKYNSLIQSIAKEVGQLELYLMNLKNNDMKSNKLFFMHPRVFSADLPIKNYIRSRFNETYQNPVTPISIIFFDIESDIIDALTDNITIGESPVNCISFYFTYTKTMYTMILRNPKNPLIAKFESKIKKNQSTLKQELHKHILEQLGSEEKVEKYELKDINFNIGFFDSEIELIATFFDLLKKLNPDFVTAWNLFGYDFPQLYERIKANGFNPEDIICDENIKPKFCEYFIDRKNYNKIEERTDFADVSCLYSIQDQEIIYASRRKGQGAIESYSLDYVAGKEAGVHKLDYHMITTNIAKFPWLDFETFVWYNVADVIAQVCIEMQTEDIRYMFNNVIEMNTPYEKIFRQTNFLWTKGMDFYKNHEQVIMGDNHNRFGEKPNEKFPGAFVASPLLLSDKNKVKIQGRPIMKFENANDFDYKALYPSLLREFNMAPHTQVGMIQIPDAPFEDKPYLKLNSGGTFNENLASYNYIEFCHRWLNMANVEEMLEDMVEYFSLYRTPLNQQQIGSLQYDRSHKVIAFRVDKKYVVSREKPLPDYLKQEVDKIREEIKLV